MKEKNNIKKSISSTKELVTKINKNKQKKKQTKMI